MFLDTSPPTVINSWYKALHLFFCIVWKHTLNLNSMRLNLEKFLMAKYIQLITNITLYPFTLGFTLNNGLIMLSRTISIRLLNLTKCNWSSNLFWIRAAKRKSEITGKCTYYNKFLFTLKMFQAPISQTTEVSLTFYGMPGFKVSGVFLIHWPIFL